MPSLVNGEFVLWSNPGKKAQFLLDTNTVRNVRKQLSPPPELRCEVVNTLDKEDNADFQEISKESQQAIVQSLFEIKEKSLL